MEKPILCKNCRQWLCSSRDLFCAGCGAGLVVAFFSTDRLALNGEKTAEIEISNSGLFQLYWAAEIVAPEPGIGALFSIMPDYGVIEPGSEQRVTVSFRAGPRNREAVRAYLEIASNDPCQPQFRMQIMTEYVSSDPDRR